MSDRIEIHAADFLLMEEELKSFREREPLVQALIAKCDGICNSGVDAKAAIVAVLYARDDLRNFKVTL